MNRIFCKIPPCAAFEPEMRHTINLTALSIAWAVTIRCCLLVAFLSFSVRAIAAPDTRTGIEKTKAFALQGDAKAQGLLGLAYFMGNGVPRDFAEAAKWATKAAEQGDALAQGLVGLMYLMGDGMPQNSAEAEKWLLKAAEQGDLTAQSLLGVLYSKGGDLPQNSAEALKWTRKAGEQGHVQSQRFLGQMFLEGEGAPRDLKQAYAWLSLAAAAGDAEAKPIMDEVAKKLSSDELAEAQAQSRRFSEQIRKKN